MEKHSKRYRSAVQVADLVKEYPLKEAVEILAKFPKAKFDETVELSFRLGVDPTSGDQMIRGTTPLPNGSGKKVRVLVFTDNPTAALAAGADQSQARARILRYTSPVSLAGLPAVTLPPLLPGQTVGVQLAATVGCDAQLLALSASIMNLVEA